MRERNDSGPEISPDGRFYLDPHGGWQPIPPTQRPGMSGWHVFWAIVGALALVLAVVWFGYAAIHSDDAVECATESLERTMDGLPPLECPE